MKARKLILSIFAVGACAATFSTTTYAWFRMNSRAYVSTLDFTVISGLGFKIAVDGSDSEYFTDTISSEQMSAAIAHGYNPDKYVFYQNELYEHEAIGHYDEIKEEDVIDYHTYKKMSYFDIQNVIKNIKLDLATTMINQDGHTTTDGYTLYGEDGYEITDSSKYLEFSLYFKADSDLATDGQHFGIYISDDLTYVRDGQKDKDGNPIEFPMNPTSIRSATQQIKLVNEMTYLNKNYEMVTLNSGDTMSLSLNNAIRFSTREIGTVMTIPKATNNPDYSVPSEGEKPVEPVVNPDVTIDGDTIITKGPTPLVEEEINTSGINPNVKIYELADENNLGSYATDYNGDENELKRMYGAEYSAMYYRYVHLDQKLDEVNPLNYADLKEMYDTGRIVTDLNSDDILTVVDSGPEAHKITFRFWLEGYDADYFAGVSGLVPISCNLSFKVNSKYGKN